MVAGALLSSSMMALLATVGPGTSVWTIRTISFFLGTGMSGIFLPSQTASFATVPPARIARGTTLFQSQQRLGAALGVAGITTVAAAVGTTRVVGGHLEPNLTSYRVGLLSAALVMLGTAVAALFVSDADAAVTMSRGADEEVAIIETEALRAA